MGTKSSSTTLGMPRIASTHLDELFQGQSSVRIPPLRTMFPQASLEGPTMLRPSTSSDVDKEVSRNSGRLMALAKAKILDGSDGSSPDIERRLQGPEQPCRKKRKLAYQERLMDTFELPKSGTKLLDDVNRKPFRSITALDQVNKPSSEISFLSPSGSPKNSFDCGEPNHHDLDNLAEDQSSGWPKKGSRYGLTQTRPRRVAERPRRKWTEAETKDLMKGIAICGLGRWKTILEHPQLHFQEGRNHVDLKDRFRTLYPRNRPEKWSRNTQKGDASAEITETRVTGPNQAGRAPYRGWSVKEDDELVKGFCKYGFRWHLYTQDETLDFEDRSANQIRDRFRRRYPQRYNEAPSNSAGGDLRTTEKTSQTQGHQNVSRHHEINAVVNYAPTDRVPFKASHFRIGSTLDVGGNGPIRASSGLTFPAASTIIPSEELEGDLDHSLRALDNDITLPPLQWDDMAVQPVFDLS